MKKIIVGNWKAHPATLEQARELFVAVQEGVRGLESCLVICPPFQYLEKVKGLAMGAQNTTEEFPPEKLIELGMKYVILGHSDVRKTGETDAQIKQKITECLAVGLKVILCVGEHEGENKEEVLKKQLAGISGVMVAYEPIWAIGTGKNCGIEETKEAMVLVKNMVGQDTIFLYGGSVKTENATDYLQNGGVDGLLVGGASLNPEEFVKIVESASV